MDHITLPKDPFGIPLRVPYLVSAFPHLKYKVVNHQNDFSPENIPIFFSETQKFLNFPKCNNIRLEELVEGNFGTKSLEEILAFLQSWCFFGFLKHTMWLSGVEIADEDLITQVPTYDIHDNVTYSESITTRILPSLREKVEARSRPSLVTPSLCQLIYSQFSVCQSTVMIFIRDLNLLGTENSLQADQHGQSIEPTLRDSIMLSIYLVGDFLYYVLMLWLPPHMSPTEPDWTYLRFFPFLKNRLLHAGWCSSEIDLLADQPIGLSTLLYLSFVNRHVLGKDHTACAQLELFHCKYENLDQYETKHTAACTQKSVEFLDIMQQHRQTIEQSVILHDIPIFTVHDVPYDQRNSTPLSSCCKESVRVEVQFWAERLSSDGSSQKPQYVAFSHVWSDGLGNKLANALPTCQMKRLQDLANRVSNREADDPIPFWLDTLCVPIEQPFRGEAIATLCEIYTNAHIVLVLDAVISEKATQDIDSFEQLMAIRTSNWTRRLWTYQEGILAHDLRFQFADHSKSSVDIGKALAVSMYKVLEAAQDHSRHTSPEDAASLSKTVEDDHSEVLLRLVEAHNLYHPSLFYVGQIQRQASEEDDESDSATSMTLEALSEPLCWRNTSRPTDEPICLSNMLQMTKEAREKIAVAPGTERMSVLLAEIGYVSKNLLFVNRARFDTPGLKWMPKSLLGGGRQATMRISPAVPPEERLAQILTSEARILGTTVFGPGFLLEGTINYPDMFFAISKGSFPAPGSDEEGLGDSTATAEAQAEQAVSRTTDLTDPFEIVQQNFQSDEETSEGFVIMADPKFCFDIGYLSTRHLAVMLKSSFHEVDETMGILLSCAHTIGSDNTQPLPNFRFEQLVKVFSASEPPKTRVPGDITAICLPEHQKWIIE